MEQSTTSADERHAQDSGRVAVPEIAELLHLQRPAAAVTAAVVVLVGLVVAFAVPSVLSPTPLVGFGVGLVALLAAVVTAIVLDGRDPVVRGPRHVRRDGHSVLARMAGPDPIEHGVTVLRALERRLGEREHLSVALTGTGTDASALAEAVGRGAAAAGHTSLVIDLRAAGAPGVSDVGAGTVRLGEAATLADDRPYAWIGAGADRAAAVSAAAGVARRPPRDLELLLIVAPEGATDAPELLRACDRTALLVAADTHQRAMVSARLEALARAGATPEAVVVGGLHLGEAATAPAAGSDVGAGRAAGVTAAGVVAVGAPEHARPTPFVPDEPAAEPEPEVTPWSAPIPPPPQVDEAVEVEEAPGEDGPVAADEPDVDSAVDGQDDDTAVDEEPVVPSPPVPDPPSASHGLDETGPLRPIAFGTLQRDDAVEADDAPAEPEGFTASDPLLTTARLEQLQERDGRG